MQQNAGLKSWIEMIIGQGVTKNNVLSGDPILK
jgi:hypothetical protein